MNTSLSETSGLTRLRGLPERVDARSHVLILGSFPSKQSLARGEYYANPRNHFWQIMERLFGLAGLSYSARMECLLARGIGIWDVIGECVRKGSLDSNITNPVSNDVCGLLAHHSNLKRVVFNGGSPDSIVRRLVPE